MDYLDYDPCHYCQHYSETYDRHTGVTDCDCGSDYGFHEDFGKKPCPGFRPILASDGLFEQLYYEEEARVYLELERDTDKEEDTDE